MEKTKVALIGLGGIGQVMHLPALLKLKEVEVEAVCDKDFGKAKNIAKRHSIKKIYKNPEDLLSENPDINAVIIATPTDTHLDVSIKCLEAGKNILVEKPIARDHKETAKIVEIAEKNNKILMVGMNNRFRNDVMLQRTFVKSKEIGNIFYVKAGWLKMKSSAEKWFMEREKAGGGVFIDNGIAMLDLGMWMMDFPEVKSVSAVNYYHNTKAVEDSNFALIKFKNGSALTIEVSWSFIRTREFYYCNVYGTNGSSSINPLRILKKMDSELFDITPKTIKPSLHEIKSSYEFELKYFISTINRKNNPISTGREALSVMQVVDAVYKSAKLGKEVIIK
ncbi:MAG: Gfo/Idh/MocA family oxidoreductase [Ignavibacteriae bacterium]|nr:Gfo/Idh/MocA family oxidoreductase [Ignavibacteriota bacterium]